MVWSLSLPYIGPNARGGGDMWVGANGAKAEVAAVDEVTIREAEIWAD
jgi:hypothetical protein